MNSKSNSYILVAEAHRTESLEFALTKDGIDFNVLLYLDSNWYVPERQHKQIDKSPSALMESGLHKFYTSFSAYKQKLFERESPNSEDDDDLQVLTIQQLKRPMIFISGFWALAIIIFITEHIISGWRKWRNRRYRNIIQLWYAFLYG